MTSFPAALRRMVQQYDCAVTSVMTQWQPSCGCDFLDSDRCKNCSEVKVFEQLVRDRLHKSK